MAPGRAPSVTFDKVDIPSHGGRGYLGKAEKQSNSKDAYKKRKMKKNWGDFRDYGSKEWQIWPGEIRRSIYKLVF